MGYFEMQISSKRISIEFVSSTLLFVELDEPIYYFLMELHAIKCKEMASFTLQIFPHLRA